MRWRDPAPGLTSAIQRFNETWGNGGRSSKNPGNNQGLVFRGNFPVSRSVAGGSGDNDWTGLNAPGATHAMGKRNRSGCTGCSVISVKPVCLGIDRLEFLFGVESAVVCVADLACGVGSHGQLFAVSSAALDDDSAGLMAMAPGSERNRKLNKKAPARGGRLPCDYIGLLLESA